MNDLTNAVTKQVETLKGDHNVMLTFALDSLKGDIQALIASKFIFMRKNEVLKTRSLRRMTR